MTKPSLSPLDLYINSIAERLKQKYGDADKNRLRSTVRFYHLKYTYGEWMRRGAKRSEMRQMEVIELPYSELEECMNKNELPIKIKELL